MALDIESTTQTLAERKEIALVSARARLNVLKGVFGVPRIGLDGASTGGDLRAIRTVLVRAGLTTEEEFSTLCAEGMDSFLAHIMENAASGVFNGET